MLLVEPVVIRPWLAEWAAEKAEIAAAVERAEATKSPATRTKRRNEAERRYREFLNRLRAFTVLDPACGSGNFLYLALQALKDLEHRVQFEAEALGAGLPAQRRVSPLAVPRFHRPDQPGAGQPFRPPLPQARRRAAVERLATPPLPDRGPAHLPGHRRGAHPAHRRPAAPEVVLRRLLSLDYVLEHRHAAWLPTEDEKVTALTAAGIAEELLPRRLYQGAVGAQYRYFPHKLPLALAGRRATFLFVQAEDETESAVRTWGGQHAALWAALAAAGRAVDVVVVGRDPVRLAAAGRVLDKWAATPPEAVLLTHQETASELAAIKNAISTSDGPALETYGGLNPAIQRARVLGAACAGDRRSRAAITRGTMWRSKRVPTCS